MKVAMEESEPCAVDDVPFGYIDRGSDAADEAFFKGDDEVFVERTTIENEGVGD
jgi:hypothetical protein